MIDQFNHDTHVVRVGPRAVIWLKPIVDAKYEVHATVGIDDEVLGTGEDLRHGIELINSIVRLYGTARLEPRPKFDVTARRYVT